ncbi:hypothetical protein [Geomicrobium sp. JCM 19039]|uniref:hypothetical protein n=1 Tax=Geomicrobium sp. JCM 19039 TaxID=1460636 RepID=UPI0026A6E6B5|nr:hypothetical protein [Geomicrobium sp. JCM 19039]
MKAFYNGTIFNGDGEKYEGQALLIEDGKVKQIVKEGDIPSQAEKVDVRGGYITPGFIDVHTHLGVSEEGIGQAGQISTKRATRSRQKSALLMASIL